MKKKFCITLLAIVAIITIFISGCDGVGITASAKTDSPVTFVKVGEVPCGEILCCEQTNVMYVMSTSSNNYGCYTLLVNADGSPMIYGG